jgi:hypothetical protein
MPTNILYAFLFSSIRAICPTHLIVLDLSILIILGEEYNFFKGLHGIVSQKVEHFMINRSWKNMSVTGKDGKRFSKV